MDSSDTNAPGWYPDPTGVHHQRYWSGRAWTARVADAYGVTAAHHIEQAFAAPDGGLPPAAPPAKSPTPSLSLVASVHEPSGSEPPAPLPVVAVVEAARPAGWYADPTGIHRKRSWDGNEWIAVVIDRNFAMLAHAITERFPPPEDDAALRTG